MHYSFEAYPLLYVAAALAIFGLPMVLLFIAAMRGMSMAHSPKPPAPAKALVAKASLPAKKRMTRRRGLKIEWVSIPVERP